MVTAIAAEAKTQVNNLVKKFGTNNPAELAELNNIKVIINDLGSANQLGTFLNYEGQKFILINDCCPPDIINYVCAHELGHALYSSDSNNTYNHFNINNMHDTEEIRINTFAVNLLLSDLCPENDCPCDINEMAKVKGIPPQFITLYSK